MTSSTRDQPEVSDHACAEKLLEHSRTSSVCSQYACVLKLLMVGYGYQYHDQYCDVQSVLDQYAVWDQYVISTHAADHGIERSI